MLIPNLNSKPTLPHNRVWFSVLLMGIFLLSACSSPVPTPATVTPPIATPVPATPGPETRVVDVERLFNTLWVLVAYGDPDNLTVIEQGVRITTEFDPESLVSGFAGCNYYTGTFEALTDGNLSFGPLVTTLMECTRGMELENAYLATLQNPESFDFSEEGRLQINTIGPNGELLRLVYTSGQAALTGNTWVLLSYGDPAAPETVSAGSVLTVNFSDDGWMSGFSGCNHFNSSFITEDGKLILGTLASSMMECPVFMEQERAFQEAISGVQTYEISGSDLTLMYNEGEYALNFTSTHLPLEHTLWTLVAIDDKQLADDIQITALFEPGEETGQGTIGGSSGCNNYNAGYKLDGLNISVEPPHTTLMACPDIMEIENIYLQALESSQSFEIFADRLILQTTNGSLIYAANRTPLSGALWTLIGIGDINDPQPPVQGSKFTAQFMSISDAPSGLLVGTTGCNEYATAYVASIDEIKINPPSRTESKSCVPGLVDQEELYFLALSDAANYRITGNSLIIPYDDDRQALIYVGTQLEVGQRLPLSDLDRTTWYLWFLNNQRLAAGTKISAHFTLNPDSVSGRLGGEAGCNRYTATFGEQLGMQTTLNGRQSCPKPAGIMDQERGYLEVLERVYGYWLTPNQLVLNSGQGILIYRQTRPPESFDQTHLLIGPNWYLVSYNNSYSVPGEREPFIRFTEEGTMSGFTGCNDIGADFETEITQITFGDISATKQACQDRALDAQETAMLDILGSARSYQLVDTAMQIVGENGVLNFSLTPVNRPGEIQPPQAEINAPAQAQVWEVVTFDASSSSAQVPIASWRWDFGDGTRGTGEVVQHVFSLPGEYFVQLTVTDKRNSWGSRSHTITILQTDQPTPGPTPTPEATPPQAMIQGPSQGFVGEPLTFDASGSQSGSSPINDLTWDFGDGTSAGPGLETMQSTIYNQPGVYQVTVLVTNDEGLSNSATLEIEITTRLDTPHVWVLDEFKRKPLLPGTAITLQFLDGKISGFAGCNSYNGTYTADLNEDGSYNVTIEPLTTSQLVCPPEIMDQEAMYLESLQEVRTVRFFKNYMDLVYPDGVMNYRVIDTTR